MEIMYNEPQVDVIWVGICVVVIYKFAVPSIYINIQSDFIMIDSPSFSFQLFLMYHVAFQKILQWSGMSVNHDEVHPLKWILQYSRCSYPSCLKDEFSVHACCIMYFFFLLASLPSPVPQAYQLSLNLWL